MGTPPSLKRAPVDPAMVANLQARAERFWEGYRAAQDAYCDSLATDTGVIEPDLEVVDVDFRAGWKRGMDDIYWSIPDNN